MANLGEVFHSGCPRRSHMMPNRRSLPPPKRISPSCVLYARYGTMDAIFPLIDNSMKTGKWEAERGKSYDEQSPTSPDPSPH